MEYNLCYKENLQLSIKDKLLENICNLCFSSKAVECVNLPSIFCNTVLISLLKDLPNNFVRTTLVCNLEQPISSSISNFVKFVQCKC